MINGPGTTKNGITNELRITRASRQVDSRARVTRTLFRRAIPVLKPANEAVCFGCWTAWPNIPLKTIWRGRCPLAISLLFQRTEPRILKSVLVRLFDPEKRDFEISLTIDVSSHGALVVCKNPLQPDACISVHSMGRSMYSPARVVHCQPLKDRSYALGLELVDPLPDWLEMQQPHAKPASAEHRSDHPQPSVML